MEMADFHAKDPHAEEEAIQGYNDSIRLAAELGDIGTRELLESILKGKEHLDLIEAQLVQIKQMGPQNYLVEQIN
jgi:bacterioferritin